MSTTTTTKNVTEARNAYKITAAEITEAGLRGLSATASGGQARLALAVFLSSLAGLKGVQIGEAVRLAPPRVSSLMLAGGLLARVGAGAADPEVARCATAIGEAWSKGKVAEVFGTKAGATLAKAITSAEASMAQARRVKRGAGTKPDTKGTKAATAKRSPAKAIGDAADALRKITEVPDTQACRVLVSAIILDAVRLAGLAGLSVETVLAEAAATAEEVTAA